MSQLDPIVLPSKQTGLQPFGSLRFSMRSLLLVVMVIALLYSLASPRYQERRSMRLILENGDQVYTEPRGLFLLRQFVGDDIAERAVYVHLNGPHVTDEWISNIAVLRHVEVLSVRSSVFTDKGLEHLKSLPNLASLNLVNTQVSDAGVEELRAALPSLRRVTRRTEDPQ